jgi:hypothetical protein
VEAVVRQAVAPSVPRAAGRTLGCSQPPAVPTSSRNTFPPTIASLCLGEHTRPACGRRRPAVARSERHPSSQSSILPIATFSLCRARRPTAHARRVCSPMQGTPCQCRWRRRSEPNAPTAPFPPLPVLLSKNRTLKTFPHPSPLPQKSSSRAIDVHATPPKKSLVFFRILSWQKNLPSFPTPALSSPLRPLRLCVSHLPFWPPFSSFPTPLQALPHASPKKPLAKFQRPHTVRAFITRMTTSPTTTLHAQGTHCRSPRPPTRVPCPCGLRHLRRPALHCPPPQLPSLNLKTAVESGRLAEAVGPQDVAPSTPRTARCASGCSQPPATSTSSRNASPPTAVFRLKSKTPLCPSFSQHQN